MNTLKKIVPDVSRPAFVFGKSNTASMKENASNNFDKGILNLTLSVDGKIANIITHL